MTSEEVSLSGLGSLRIPLYAGNSALVYVYDLCLVNGLRLSPCRFAVRRTPAGSSCALDSTFDIHFAHDLTMSRAPIGSPCTSDSIFI